MFGLRILKENGFNKFFFKKIFFFRLLIRWQINLLFFFMLINSNFQKFEIKEIMVKDLRLF